MELKAQLESHAKHVKERNAYSRKNDSWDFMKEMEKKWLVWRDYITAHNGTTDMIFNAYNKSVTLPAEGAFYLMFDKIERAKHAQSVAERERDFYKKRYESVLGAISKDVV